jgi:hypothetical protein
MNSQDVCSIVDAQDCTRQASFNPVLRRIIQDSADEGFAGKSGQNGAVEYIQEFQIADQAEVIFEIFPESDARIEDDFFPFHTRIEGGRYTFGKKGFDFLPKVIINGIILHGFGDSPHVHENCGDVFFAGERKHFRIRSEGADVVDDVGSGLKRLLGNFGFGGVNRKESLRFFPEFGNNGDNTPQLFSGWDRVGPGAGTFSAYVDDISPFRRKPEALGYGRFPAVEQVSIREGIGSDIEDAHDPGPATE